MTQIDLSIVKHAIECCDAWEPDARLIGNVRAEDLGKICRAYLSQSTPTDVNDRIEKAGNEWLEKTLAAAKVEVQASEAQTYSWFVVQKFACNGNHSHFEIMDTDGKTIVQNIEDEDEAEQISTLYNYNRCIDLRIKQAIEILAKVGICVDLETVHAAIDKAIRKLGG